MGIDSVAPFLKHGNRAVFVLCKTSNPSSNDFQTLRIKSASADSVGGEDGRMLYEQVAKVAQESWNTGGAVGLVVGATDVEVSGVGLSLVRKEHMQSGGCAKW
jgi:orotidine-5'-phosphate decarboxylase